MYLFGGRVQIHKIRRGKKIHFASGYRGLRTFCGIRLHKIQHSPNDKMNCPGCQEMLDFFTDRRDTSNPNFVQKVKAKEDPRNGKSYLR
jgi:hypothetical protein